MNNHQLLDLSDCSEFRQRLESKTPPAARIVMITLLLLVGAAVVWAIMAKASLVIIAQGRVRPIETPNRVYSATSQYLDGRVVESLVKEGDLVKQGDLLLRLDSSRIDNEIARQTYTIESGNTELAELKKLTKLLDERTSAAKQQAIAELNHLLADHEQAVLRRASDIRRAEAALAKSQDHSRRTKLLFQKKVAAEASLIEAHTQLSQDKEALKQARLTLDDGAIDAKRQALKLIDREHRLKHAELVARVAIREGEVKAAEKQLATLQYERQHAELRSPIDGVVVTGNVKVGDMIERGQPVLEIASEDSLRFEAQVSSKDVGDLREGMPVNLKLDAFDFQKYGTVAGKVSYVSPDSRVPESSVDGAAYYQVKIELDDTRLGRDEFIGQVKLGMAGVAEIVTDRESLLSIFTQQMRKTIRIE